jgi:folate-dependent phosphoribosylglycinamide formyltransferase PurN
MEREEAERIIGKRDLRRKYTGDDAVFDAVTAGEDYTLSTVHVAIEEPDMGPIIVQSQAFQVDQNRVRGMSSKELRQYVDDLQGEMKTLCDGPAYLKALELLAAGLSVTADRRLILNGEELLYGGVQL